MNVSQKSQRKSLQTPGNVPSSKKNPDLLHISYPGLNTQSKVYYPMQLVESPERHKLIELNKQRNSQEARKLNLRKRSMTHLFGITATRRNTLRAFDEVNSYTHLRQISQSQAIHLSLPSKKSTSDSEYAVLSSISQTRLLYTHPKAVEILGMSEPMHARYNALRVSDTAGVLPSERSSVDRDDKGMLITELPPPLSSHHSGEEVENGDTSVLDEEELQLLSTRATLCESDITPVSDTQKGKEGEADLLTLNDLILGSSTQEEHQRKINLQRLANLERQRLIAKITSACIPATVKLRASIGAKELTLKPVQSIPSLSVTESQTLDKTTHKPKNMRSTSLYLNKLVRPMAEKSYIPFSGTKEDAIRHAQPSFHKFVTDDSSHMIDLVRFIPSTASDMRRRSRDSILDLSSSGGPRVSDVLDALVWSQRVSTSTGKE